MILVETDLPADTLELPLHRGAIVVIEPVALVAHLDAHRHLQAVALCTVQHRAHPGLVHAGAPRAEGIAPARGQRFLAVATHARALHTERRAIDQQDMCAVLLDDADLRWRRERQGRESEHQDRCEQALQHADVLRPRMTGHHAMHAVVGLTRARMAA